ncbi:SDR family NAD(P)-dependent oxidoreductase [Acinetobacter sp. 226-4]|uniref:SDR family NAD(P)-dependent oxidoreductase n=1 Tax=Acinetobacter sp. 226-4 TaxID=2746719 RepID=UPI00257689BB|nr:SDR family NAD(P)-dependent oxidoreductase [Acinetobacter sp. 226-4]MDM1768124.1 SDR family NAD(P)-dependent oxidoreductase [Acinetobacter sp. 226-4]
MTQNQDLTLPSVVVFGVGAQRGIGAAVCRRFAQEGLKVHVVGRTATKVDRVTTEIINLGGQAISHCINIENQAEVKALFDSIHQERVEAVIHNVGGNIPSIFLKTTAGFFNKMWKSTFSSAYIVSQYSLNVFQHQQNGTLIFTGASASMRGKPYCAAFTMGKSALRNYALNLAKIYKPLNIHIAHVVIDGMVDGDRVNQAVLGFGRLLRLTRGTGGLNIEAIAENYWMLYQQKKELWTHELDLRPYQEKF